METTTRAFILGRGRPEKSLFESFEIGKRGGGTVPETTKYWEL
jgi:hypothetical protein